MTALGLVEYAEVGAGSNVLIVHGVPGGYDQGIIVAGLLDGPYRFLAVSRPGYLGTPLSTGASPEAQADAYAALLDTLRIDRVAAIAISGGGPSTLQFALRHPHRCWGVVTMAAVTMHRPRSLVNWLVRWLPLSDRGSWILGMLPALIPTGLAQALGVHPATLALIGNGLDAPVRGTGIRNDLAEFEAIKTYHLERITAPTLVLHGISDRVVPAAHAEHAAAAIPGARYVRVAGGGHVFFVRPEVRAAVLAFLAENAPQSPAVDLDLPVSFRP